MKILVTGGAGFIGSSLIDRLLALGHQVTALDCFNDFYPTAVKEANLRGAMSHPNFCLIRGDVGDQTVLASAFGEKTGGAGLPEVVVHLAARAGVRPSIADPLLYCRDNIDATAALLEGMRTFGVQRLVFASSSSVYGNRPETLFSEDLDVSTPISPYAATKSAGEQLIHVWSRLYGISSVALRFFTVYGPRQRPDLAIAKFCRLIREGKPIPVFGDGSTVRDYTYIDDILDGVIAAIYYDKTPYEIVNLGGGEPVSLARMIAVIEETLGQRAIIQRFAPQPGDVVKTAADIRKASRLFGYAPKTTFCSGIKKYVAWLDSGRKS